LIEKNLCPKEKIELLFGVPVQFRKTEIDMSKKRFYEKDKTTFDLCFVAFKYDDIGRSKGYDLFIEAAKILASKPKNADMRFHVVGDFDETVIDVSEIKNRITFYGVRTAEWLHAFYYAMDVAVAPVRPFLLYEGGFDGYPMCFEQGVCGVAMFQSDELNINRDYRYYKEDEVVNIKLDTQDIASKIEYYFSNVEKLYALAEKGRQRTQSLCGLEERTDRVKEILLAVAATA
jgi:glycosyltransferase involved in cell wall biosynthesis